MHGAGIPHVRARVWLHVTAGINYFRMCSARTILRSLYYMEPVKLVNPKITVEGYAVDGRGFTDYILHADDIVKA